MKWQTSDHQGNRRWRARIQKARSEDVTASWLAAKAEDRCPEDNSSAAFWTAATALYLGRGRVLPKSLRHQLVGRDGRGPHCVVYLPGRLLEVHPGYMAASIKGPGLSS